jgi:hypothetical protein
MACGRSEKQLSFSFSAKKPELFSRKAVNGELKRRKDAALYTLYFQLLDNTFIP